MSVNPLRIGLQILLAAALMLVLGYFSTAPAYHTLEPGAAVIKLAVRHTGQRLGACTPVSEKALAHLPANMRSYETCPRERSPLAISLSMDGKPLYKATHAPAGLSGDGVTTAYARFTIQAGRHLFSASLNDDINHPERVYKTEHESEIKAGQVLVMGFDSGQGAFTFK